MKKLLILAGVIALTSTMQTFAQEPPVKEGPCPVKKIECTQTKLDTNKNFKKCHCDKIQKLEKDLKLTAEQKAQAKALREAEAEKIKPILEQIKVKHQEMQQIFDTKLTFKERQEQLTPVRKDLFELKKQIRDIKRQGRKDFEAILTTKQLKKLEKIKKQHKEEFKKNHKDRMHRRHQRMMRPCPLPAPALEQKPLPAEEIMPLDD